MLRLPEFGNSSKAPIDKLVADIRLPRNEPDPVTFARGYLKAAPTAPTPQPK